MWEPPNLFPVSHQTARYVVIDSFPVLKQAYYVDNKMLKPINNIPIIFSRQWLSNE